MSDEVKLKEEDFRAIAEHALRSYKENAIIPKQQDLFVCQCYVKAVVSFITSKGLVVKDGKLVKPNR